MASLTGIPALVLQGLYAPVPQILEDSLKMLGKKTSKIYTENFKTEISIQESNKIMLSQLKINFSFTLIYLEMCVEKI